MVNVFKAKDSNKCVYQKKKVLVTLVKRNDFMERCSLKKGYCETF